MINGVPELERIGGLTGPEGEKGSVADWREVPSSLDVLEKLRATTQPAVAPHDESNGLTPDELSLNLANVEPPVQ